MSLESAPQPAIFQEFNITFKGPALDENAIDAKILANSLLGLSETIEEANSIINGKNSQIFVKVRANPKPGSFIESILTLISSNTPDALVNIAALLGFSKGLVVDGAEVIGATTTVLEIYRRIQNKKIINEEPISPNFKKITYGEDYSTYINGDDNTVNNTFITTEEALKLFKSGKIKKQIAQVMSPLDEEGVDSILFGDEIESHETITKAEKQYFKAPEKESIAENIIEMILTVITPDLSGHMKGWKFSYYDNEGKQVFIIADVEDEEFLEDVANSIHSFKNGVEIKARVRIVQNMKIRRTTTHTIVKVIEVIQPYFEEEK